MKIKLRGERKQDAVIEGAKFCGVAAAMVGSAAIGAIASSQSSKPSGQQTTTQQQQMDPRVSGMLFGSGAQQLKPGVTPTYGADGQASNPSSDYTTDGGLLSQYQGMLGKPQDPSMAQYGQTNLDYLKNNGATDMGKVQGAAGSLMGGTTAPTASPGAWAVGNMVQAPSQNNLDLSGSYNKMINGDAGANPYLTKALQSGVDQTNASYGQNLTNLTDTLQRTVLPGIRSDSVLAGQYGGSRQGIAEGNAIGDYTKAATSTNLQLGLANSANTTGAQAQAYSQGQDRSLAAMQGLGAQQYGVAQQDAATKNAAEFTNVGNVQQTTMGNQGAQLQTNQLNQNGTLAGAGLLSGQMAGAYGVGQNQDQYAVKQAGQVNGLLAPYLGQVPGSSTSSQPLYSNPAGNAFGGAAAGLALGKQFGGLLGSSTPSSNPGAGSNGFVDWSNYGNYQPTVTG